MWFSEYFKFRKLAKLYKKQGYLVIDSKLPESVIDGAVQDLNEFRKNPDPSKVSFIDDNRIQDAWKISPNCKEIALNPYIMRLLLKLYDRTPKPFQTLNFPVGTEQHVHSDALHFNSEPFGFMCGAWVALEDVGPDQGPLEIYPGSHHHSDITFETIGEEAHYKNYPQYLDYLDNLIKEKKWKRKVVTMKKGEVVIWAANLLHGGTPHNDKSLSRHSQVTHIYFSDIKAWRPGHSADGIHYFDPQWIN